MNSEEDIILRDIFLSCGKFNVKTKEYVIVGYEDITPTVINLDDILKLERSR